jgi:hypothetical protein
MLRQPPPTTGPLHEEARGGRVGFEFRTHNEHLAVHNARARFIGSYPARGKIAYYPWPPASYKPTSGPSAAAASRRDVPLADN